MTVKDYITTHPAAPATAIARPAVPPEAHALEALRAWRLSPDGCVDVARPGMAAEGTLESSALLSALADIFTLRPESALVEAACPAADYSASSIARAVEDADTPLLGLWRTDTSVSTDAKALLMIGASDASSVCRSLRRYGFSATPLTGNADEELQTALANINALKMFLEI